MSPSLAIALLVGVVGSAGCRSRGEARSSPHVTRILAPADPPLPLDLMPMDVDRASGRVLCVSYSHGMVELERASGGWRVARRWHPGRELPQGVFGEARYGIAGAIYLIWLDHGLLKVTGDRASLIDTPGLHGHGPYRVLVRHGGELWIGYPPLPFGGASNATVQVLRDERVVRTIALEERESGTITRWLEVESMDAVVAATPAGLVALRSDGSRVRRSSDAVSSIAQDRGTGSLGAAGTVIGRWRGERLEPVLFGLPAGRSSLHGNPIDLAIDSSGRWYLLYDEGLIARLTPDGRLLDTLDVADGIPRTASRLLAHPPTGDVLIGSRDQGMTVAR